MAVIAVYDVAGSPLGGFTGEKGTPLTGASATAGQGVTPGAMIAVGRTGAVSKKASAAEAKYLKRYVGFHGLVLVGSTGVVGAWSYPFQGNRRRILQPEEYYTVVGRTDLAESYSTRSGAKTGLMWGGISGFILGGSLMGGAALKIAGSRTVGDDLRGVEDPPLLDDPLFVSGIVIGSVGLVAWISSMFIERHPVSAEESVDLARQYNRKLRSDLGLPPLEDDPLGDESKAEPLSVEFGFGVAPTEGGAYVGMAGIF